MTTRCKHHFSRSGDVFIMQPTISSLLALSVKNRLCVLYATLCQKGGETVWIPRSDGSTTRMKNHLIDVHNMYVGGFMHLMHDAFFVLQ